MNPTDRTIRYVRLLIDTFTVNLSDGREGGGVAMTDKVLLVL